MVYLVTGIGTDVGKTVVSSVLVKALNASYWKPIQAGDLKNSDSIKVAKMTNANVFPEAFVLNEPMSPHAAAKLDGKSIDLQSLSIPECEGDLIVEGAGGIMVPINDQGDTYLDLFALWDHPIVVVSRHYLGSINHTLLTIEVIHQKGLNIHGIIFVGDENEETERIIEKKTGCRILGRVDWCDKLDAEFISDQASQISKNWNKR